MKDPPIRALFVAANNPAVTCPDAQAVRRGLAREDLFTVVHDPFLSDTARYADLVLPAATYLETEDLHPRLRHLLHAARAAGGAAAGRGAVEPPGRAASWRAASASRDAVFSMSTDELIATVVPRRHRSRRRRSIPTTLREHRPIKRRCPMAARGGRRRPGGSSSTPSTLAAQGLRADARLGRGSPRRRAGRALAAAPADGARLLPEPHRVLGRTDASAARRGAGVRPASRRRGQRAGCRTATTSRSSTISARCDAPPGLRRGRAGRRRWCPVSGRPAKPDGRRQHALLARATPISARARPIRARSWT